ncbi:response regulator [Paenibacillus mesophilus]|uniref:response regulator transcription factor n=1 Tax=Paenibacillus mesophilus TaxID=2582849 RepID=UPI00110EE709|nr:response regulator [Paenibacillus mesophilus]TMV48675.1 response regulator [Paenibacillus mesophilus]
MANLMIVDDSKIIRQRLRAILEDLGHCIVSEAANGKEALENYKRMEKEIDLITLDIEMPGINGMEVIRLLREHNPSAAIVMISSVEDRSNVLKAIRLGAKHYFVKPFTETKIKEVIGRVLGFDTNPNRTEALRENPEANFRVQTARRMEDSAGGMLLKSENLESLPFELFHMDERTLLIIRSPITDTNAYLLYRCLQGLLYFRKMKFVLELWEPVRHREGARLLHEFIQDVRSRHGKAAVVTDDTRYYTEWLSDLGDDVYRAYKEIKW